MKILELRLTAFGPFTDRTLDLSAGSQGLHVIFGPNETGKSSALRALHALLYGIPGQTSDAFLHPYDALRLGGRLRLSNGDQIEFVRRKGKMGTLLAPDNTRLDDHALDRFLSGVGPEQFRMFWGIDHARLVQGGREILEGHGDLGESLFAAGSGASHLRALRKNLNEEATALFAPHGRSRVVNLSIGQLRDLRSAQREVTVSADEWARQDRALREAEERLADGTERARGLSMERSRLERVKRVLPLIAERDDLHRRLADLGDVVLLAEDFAKRRQAAETALRMAQQRLERTVRQLHEQEEVVAKLGPTPPLPTESGAVNDLHQRLGSHRKAQRDRPGLVARLSEQRVLAERLLGELRPDLDIERAETLRVYVGRRARIQKLSAERERLDERLQSARRRHKEAREQSKALADEASSLPAARDSEKLVAAIEETRHRGGVEAERDKVARTAERLVAQRDALMAKLRLPESVVNRLEELRVLAATSIARFERKAQELEEEARADTAERQRVAKTTRDLDAKIENLRTKKAVPTEEDLAAARQRRDTAFRLLREQWEKGRDVTVEARELLGKGKLVDLYVGTVKEADDVADRLRGEADRVAELAQYLEERRRLDNEVEEADAASRRREKTFEELDVSWRQEWKSVLAPPPQIHAARAWCEDFARLLERSEALAEALHQRNELDAWTEKHVKSLRAVMEVLEPVAPLADGLAETMGAAEKLRKRVEEEDRIRGDHARRTHETERAVREAGKAERDALAELDAWQSKWIEAVRGLVQGDPPQPDDALIALDGVEKTLRALDEAAGYEARIAGIDRDAESFRGDVLALAERLHEAAAAEGGSEDAWVEALHERLATVLREEERRQQAHDRLDNLRVEVKQEEEAVESANMALGALREEARSGADGDLVGAERRSDELRVLRADLARTEKNLVLGGDGASIAQLEAAAEGADKDAIDVRLGQFGTEMQEVDMALAEARDARAGAQAELRRLRGPSAASEKAEEIQATLARLGEDVLRYARLRVASTLLTRRIDDYRRKNQAPLLLRAGVLLRELTLGGFERLEADVEDDRPVLVGVKADGTVVPAHGMSEGTTDQLFLALRLAAVEASCAAGEPMPFIVDDVLVQFDDDRSAAALRVLAEAAARTQVVLFTHHIHVRRCAEALTAPAMVAVHEL